MRPVISLYYRNILLYIFSAFDTVGTGDRKDILPARNPALKSPKGSPLVLWGPGLTRSRPNLGKIGRLNKKPTVVIDTRDCAFVLAVSDTCFWLANTAILKRFIGFAIASKFHAWITGGKPVRTAVLCIMLAELNE